jgi:hypothetical protein
MIHVERATLENAALLARDLELFGCGSLSLEDRREMVAEHVRASTDCFVWLEGARPIAMAGVVPRSILAGAGAVWLLRTPEATRNVRRFWCTSRAVVAYLRGQWVRLEGRVDGEYAASSRWLKRLGFAVHNEPFTYEGRTFLAFAMER